MYTGAETDQEAQQSLASRLFDVLPIPQESLTNVARHAAATRVLVKVSVLDDDTVLLEVSDNGRGITEEQARPCSMSFGLAGVRERGMGPRRNGEH